MTHLNSKPQKSHDATFHSAIVLFVRPPWALGIGNLRCRVPFTRFTPFLFAHCFFIINLFILFKVFVSQILGKITSSTPFLTKLQVAGLRSPTYVIPSQQRHFILMWYYFMDYSREMFILADSFQFTLVLDLQHITLQMFTAYVTWM